MRFLVTGAGGMLGRDLVDVVEARPEHQVTPATRADLDITDPAAVHAAVAGHDVVVNTAAWTDVDGAETHESSATAVNGDAVAHLATACAAHGTRLLHLSTDYVFDGTATTPYPEDAPTAPLNAYGRGKLIGEQAVTRLLPDTGYVVRTAWLYGAHGRNFVTTMLDLADRRGTLDVVDDQRGQPTWSHALARHLVALAEAAHAGRAAPGIYHGTCSGETTWYGLARAVFARHGLDPDRIRPTTSARFVRPAPRPTYSVLGHGRWAEAGLPPLPDWHATLADAFAPAAPPSPWKVV
ncbi:MULTISPECIES: dTDP-4-dehydrorhamnose reductase [unclassified Micromonospora]|uniref:dTDP-4-dehydrorhamnose reductase n=1 Tax=unclassified Micromonospora TaxID=2617518 RepID=UPI0022B60915|nr:MULTISPECIES: dTDP-4-dehydrorhamnose reductase [unclassified Micromonospora]MCZ7422829.1 dTDP-4-dehydrorhamnose reductase [Verrucosispora sp. WMMA2121]WBB90563.1 dTDP-4-dehydrorhamnose reductase [Verrucosispora sp. WMMC514]